MSFSSTWHNLIDNVEELPDDATLLTPLSNKSFAVGDTQEHRILIEYREDDRTVPLQRDQFETLARHVEGSQEGFDLDRLPPDAEPYGTVLSLHPRFELDERDGILRETETPTSSPLVDTKQEDTDDDEREEPDIAVYSDALLLIDALERHSITQRQSLVNRTFSIRALDDRLSTRSLWQFKN